MRVGSSSSPKKYVFVVALAVTTTDWRELPGLLVGISKSVAVGDGSSWVANILGEPDKVDSGAGNSSGSRSVGDGSSDAAVGIKSSTEIDVTVGSSDVIGGSSSEAT